MRYFYDFEFVEDGVTIEPISIGIVAEDGREYYAHIDGYDEEKARAHLFVSREVLPHVEGVPKTPKEAVAEEVARFIRWSANDLWGYFPSYDQVCLAQLFGTMTELPSHIPMRTNDICTLAQLTGRRIPGRAVDDGQHHALADARWTKAAFDELARGILR